MVRRYSKSGAAMIRAVILDYDGTLVTFDREKALGAALEATGKTASISTARLGALDRERALRGACSRRGLLEEALPELGEEEIRRGEAAFWQSIKDTTRPAPGALALVRHCREAGLGLGLLTDWDGAPGLKASRLEASGLVPHFDAVVIGGETLAARKPAPEAFRAICERLNVLPGEAMMIGDKVEADLLPARDLGLTAVWFQGEYPGRWSPRISDLGEVIPLL